VPEGRILERPGEADRVGEAIRGQLLERLPDRGVHVDGDRPADRGRRDGAALQDLAEHRLRGASHVRRIAREQLEEHRTERVDVARRSDDLIAGRLLGAHVVGRADAQPRLGQARPARRSHRERDAEVPHDRLPRLDQDVRGLDVAVDHAVLVRVFERARHRHREAYRLVHGQLLLAVQAIPERLAFHERHHVEEEAGGLAGVVQRQDVRVLEVGGGLDLGQEALAADDGRELGLEHLYRDLPVVPQVSREIDLGHATFAELPLDVIATGQGRVQPLDRDRVHFGGFSWGVVGARMERRPEHHTAGSSQALRRRALGRRLPARWNLRSLLMQAPCNLATSDRCLHSRL
jgi:hypothetical protein